MWGVHFHSHVTWDDVLRWDMEYFSNDSPTDRGRGTVEDKQASGPESVLAKEPLQGSILMQSAAASTSPSVQSSLLLHRTNCLTTSSRKGGY